MKTEKPKTRGGMLARRLHTAINTSNHALLPGARDLPVLKGLNSHGKFILPQENVLMEGTQILLESRRVFRRGKDIVLRRGGNQDGSLPTLGTKSGELQESAHRLANLFLCELPPDKSGVCPQMPPPPTLVGLLLNREPTIEKLPEITGYFRRPVYDPDFVLQQAGWNPKSGYLIHAPEVEAIEWEQMDLAVERPWIDRLPPHLANLLRDFCFVSAADAANFVAVLLTGLLMPHFIEDGKPLVIFDGNQSGVGKSLLAKLVSVVLDGCESPVLVTFTSVDDQLGNRICATLREGTQTVLIIDNAKLKTGEEIGGPTLESLSVASRISIRILHQSANFERPNDVIWCITMNNTQAGKDVVDRFLPIRLAYAGVTRERDFGGNDPRAYAIKHRAEILGELVGMIDLWIQRGRPHGKARHRLTKWAGIVSGILEVNGLPEALANIQEAVNEFDSETDDLSALAESVVSMGGPYQEIGGTRDSFSGGKSGREWVQYFKAAGVLRERLESLAGLASVVGRFLKANVNRNVAIELAQRTGQATLRMEKGRKNQTLYHLEVEWDDGPRDATEPTSAAGLPTPLANHRERNGTAFGHNNPRQPQPRFLSRSSNPTAGRSQNDTHGGGGNCERW